MYSAVPRLAMEGFFLKFISRNLRMLYKRSTFGCPRTLFKRHFTRRIKYLVVCISESIGRIFLKLHTPPSSRMTYKDCKVRWAISQTQGTLLGEQNPVDRSKLRALYLNSHVFLGLHLGFHWIIFLKVYILHSVRMDYKF